MPGKRRPARPADPAHDSTNHELAAEEAAEKKVVWLWQQFDQIYGIRWSQAFGNDPLGKYKNAQNQQNPRMEQWIDALRVAQWPAIKQAVYRCRTMPKPYDGWLPDLQHFSALLGRTAPVRPQDAAPAGTWVEKLCGLYLLKIMFSLGPFSQASVEKLREVNRQAIIRFNAMLESEDLSKEGLTEEREVVIRYLALQHKQLTIEPMSEEEKLQILRRRSGSLLTRENSSS